MAGKKIHARKDGTLDGQPETSTSTVNMREKKIEGICWVLSFSCSSTHRRHNIDESFVEPVCIIMKCSKDDDPEGPVTGQASYRTQIPLSILNSRPSSTPSFSLLDIHAPWE